MKANLQPVAPIIPPAKKETIKPVQPEQVSQPVSKKDSPSEGKISCTLFNSCYCSRFVIMRRCHSFYLLSGFILFFI